MFNQSCFYKLNTAYIAKVLPSKNTFKGTMKVFDFLLLADSEN